MPHSQERHGGSIGPLRTDATARAEPGLLFWSSDYEPDRVPLDLQVMGQRLDAMVQRMSENPDEVSARGVYSGIVEIENQCMRIRRLGPRLVNDFPLCLGNLLDVMA